MGDFWEDISDEEAGINMCGGSNGNQQQRQNVLNLEENENAQQAVQEAPVQGPYALYDETFAYFRHRASNKRRSQRYSSNLAEEQSDWGRALPSDILTHIFSFVCDDIGSLPFLVRAAKVCQLWNRVANSSALWRDVDLSVCVKPAFRNEIVLKWLIENKLAPVRDLNLGDWKVENVDAVLEALHENCSGLCGLTLSGWEALTPENIEYIAKRFHNLTQFTLSNMKCDSRVVAAQSMMNVIRIMNERLTNFGLPYNSVRGIPQIVTGFANLCPNLEVLDISNLRLTSTAMINLELLQQSCGRLKVFRITNSSIAFSPIPHKAQITSPGFPALEECSVAGIGNSIDTFAKPFIDDEAIERLLKTSTKLKLLDVRGHSSVKDSCLAKLPAVNLEQLLMSGCKISRAGVSGLPLILRKWNHSLRHVDLSWVANKEQIDSGLLALVECRARSQLRAINLCGSAVSIHVVEALMVCPLLRHMDLSSCRGIPRGMKRQYGSQDIAILRKTFAVGIIVD